MVIMVLMLLLSQTAESATVNIDLNTTHQTIRGFGGMNSPRWIGTLTNAQVDKAFGNGSGQLGFTIMRCDVPPSSSYWSGEVSAAVRAKSNGAIVFASPWSPPASMKTNNSLIKGELKTDSYDDFANYLSDFANYMSSNGASLYAVSVQNEPDWLPDYESCGWSASQMQTFLNNNASVIPVKVIAPETVHYKSDYVSAVASSSQCDIVACHLYGGTITSYSGKEYWATEYNENNTDWTSALNNTGVQIHDCMTANMSAYIWWYVRRSYSPLDESGNITNRGYVMAHFSKYVRPGYTRVDATASSSSGVYVTAYKSGSNLVIVALNTNGSSQSVTFSLSGGSVSSYTKYESTSGSKLSNKGSVGSTDTLAASSINTYIGTIVFETCDDVQDANYGLLSDLNGDCYVNYIDLKIISDHWLDTDCTEPENCGGADFAPTDGVVDLFDFSDFAMQWLWCNNPEDTGCVNNW
jgi:O-glycosyl hydrolase